MTTPRMTDEALCVMCAQQDTAALICDTCEAKVRRDLDRIGKARRMLDPRPASKPGGGKSPGKPGSRPPVDLTVVAMTDRRTRRIVEGWHDAECQVATCGDADCVNPDHRADCADDVLNVDAELLAMARMCIEERHLSAPMADALDAIRVVNLSFDWLVRHPAVEEHATVLADCAQALRTALRDHPERSLGRCPSPDPRGELDRCGGPLRWRSVDAVAWSSGQVDDIAAVEVECARCLDTWGPRDLEHLGRVSPLPLWDTVPRVAEMLGMSERTLRYWVLRGRVHKDAFGRVRHAEAWHVMTGAGSA